MVKLDSEGIAHQLVPVSAESVVDAVATLFLVRGFTELFFAVVSMPVSNYLVYTVSHTS